jgi:hypothetical protein
MGDPEMSDYVVKEEMGRSVHRVIECWHGFSPLCKIVNYHNDLLVGIFRWEITCHKVNSPLAKGIGSDDSVKRS